MDRLTLAVIAAQQPLACIIDKDGDEWCAECLNAHVANTDNTASKELWFVDAHLAGKAPFNRICFWCHAVAEVYRGDEPA